MVFPESRELEMMTSLSPSRVTGDAFGTVDGKTVLQLKGLRLSPVEGNAPADADPHAAVELEWKPDIDFLEEKNLMKVFKSRTPTGGNYKADEQRFGKFMLRVEEQKLRILSGKYPLVPDVGELANLDQSVRMERIDTL
ncbi:uncharacterized protein BP5553_01452 [Venustampulla echinocandica]|uniref:Uncharacterized protein n=1 Tax=Venustampulla echinocandica TaxID=2656787 RepID=A0A370U148_9HELO|nr:uncharacterized protein BP5553_01452 [Venustampulla echinocandica]RDL41473.1 hypothetical protein BP5553_01452 [Venustampulla echinocandica]